MTQLSPTNVSRAQLADRLARIKQLYDLGQVRTVNDLQVEFESAMNDYFANLGLPTVKWDPIVFGEPPSSTKINEFWNAVATDVEIAEDEVDILRSAITFSHNLIKTEILKARNQNAQLDNKLKTLQLYSSVQDRSVYVFGDYFKSTDFADLPKSTSVDIDTSGEISLVKTQNVNASRTAVFSILDTSNGFAGNNQEVVSPQDARENPVTKEKDYVFYGQSSRVDDLKAIQDNNPITWFEYEKNFIYPADRALAQNLNFTYINDVKSSTSQPNQLDWADGPSNEVLSLDIEIDLKAKTTISNFTYAPFGLRGDRNHPVLIKTVAISEDGTNWSVVGNENVWVGTNTSVQTLRGADNISLGTARWSFEPTLARYVRVSLEQPSSIESNIGHVYYKNKDVVSIVEKSRPDPATPNTEVRFKETTTTEGVRIEGPNPRVSRPYEHYSASRTDFGSYTQKREVFQGRRWAIGIRDITVGEVRYGSLGSYVSKPFEINGVIDRVAIESDFRIPTGFDPGVRWVRFFVSPNNGLSWFEISPMSTNYYAAPEVVVFNDPLPFAFRDPNVGYYNVDNIVNTIRVKIELSRPSAQSSASPVVTNYRLKVQKR